MTTINANEQGGEADLEIIGAGRKELIAYMQGFGPVYTTKVLLACAHTP